MVFLQGLRKAPNFQGLAPASDSPQAPRLTVHHHTGCPLSTGLPSHPCPFLSYLRKNPWKMLAMKTFSLLVVSLLLAVVLGEERDTPS